MLFRRFLNWLYGTFFGRARQANTAFALLDQTERPSPDAANVLQQDIRETGAASAGLAHDLRNNIPFPESLSRAAEDYNDRQLRLANEQYDAFLAGGYERLLIWIARLLKEDADHGGSLFTLSFDHSTSKVEASGLGLMRAYSGHYFGSAGELRYFGLPFSPSLICLDLLIDRLAASISDHFRALTFHVDVTHVEPVYSRRRSTPRTTVVMIFWGATPKRPVLTDDVESATGSLSLMDTSESLSIVHREPSYQTAQLGAYDPVFQKRAVELFQRVEERVGNTKAKAYKGSYSIISSRGSQTAAKIIIYENGLGRMNGDWPSLPDGVYVLIRADGLIGDSIWSNVWGFRRSRTLNPG